MGDRANIVVKDGNNAVFLYSHWGGHEMPQALQAGLARAVAAGRENDGSYLARILFCELVRHDIDGTTGYGISADLTDNEHPLLVVDTDRRTVTEYPEAAWRGGRFATLSDYPAVPVGEYAGQWSQRQ